VARLTGHTSYVFSVSFDPTGERFVTGSGDGTVRIWETAPVAARLAARRDRERIVAQVEPVVLALFEQGKPPSEIVDLLKNQHSFASPRHREVALQMALRESLRRSQ
jgi:WD40 repeat protein